MPILGRCVLGEEGCEVPLRGGRDVRLVGLFLGATGVGCLWSSLPKLWKTSSKKRERRKRRKISTGKPKSNLNTHDGSFRNVEVIITRLDSGSGTGDRGGGRGSGHHHFTRLHEGILVVEETLFLGAVLLLSAIWSKVGIDIGVQTGGEKGHVGKGRAQHVAFDKEESFRVREILKTIKGHMKKKKATGHILFGPLVTI